MLAGGVMPAALAVSTSTALLEESGGQVNRWGHSAGGPQTNRASTQVGLAGIPSTRVGVRQSEASALLLGRVLWCGQEAGVKFS